MAGCQFLTLLLSAFVPYSAVAQPIAGSVTLVSPAKAVIGIVADKADTTVGIVFSTSEGDITANKGKASSSTNVTTTAGFSNYYTASITLDNLTPETTYYFGTTWDGVLQTSTTVPRFRTFPAKDTNGEFSFTVFGNAALSSEDRSAQCYVSGGNGDNAVQGNAKYSYDASWPLFAVQLGNFDVSQPTSLDEARAMHVAMRDPSLSAGAQFVDNILTKLGLYHTFMEHDYCGGNDPDRFCPTKYDAIQAFKEYYDGYPYANDRGLWYSFSIGNMAEVFVLDTMTQRDPAHWPDNSTKSMLQGGSPSSKKLQKAWFLNALQASSARWKIVISSVGANKYTYLKDGTSGTDPIAHWADYATEAKEIAKAISANGDLYGRTVMITGNLQTGGAIDDGRNNMWGIPELSVPISNLAQGNANNLGTWSVGVISGQDNKGKAEGFARVTVTHSTLTLETLDQVGKQTFNYQVVAAAATPSVQPSISSAPTDTWRPSAQPTKSPQPTSTMFPSPSPTSSPAPSFPPTGGGENIITLPPEIHPEPSASPTIGGEHIVSPPTLVPTGTPETLIEPPTSTDTPTQQPVLPPTDMPTSSPVPPPTDTPTFSPVPPPTDMPTSSPVPPPTDMPTFSPFVDVNQDGGQVQVSAPNPNGPNISAFGAAMDTGDNTGDNSTTTPSTSSPAKTSGGAAIGGRMEILVFGLLSITFFLVV